MNCVVTHVGLCVWFCDYVFVYCVCVSLFCDFVCDVVGSVIVRFVVLCVCVPMF